MTTEETMSNGNGTGTKNASKPTGGLRRKFSENEDAEILTRLRAIAAVTREELAEKRLDLYLQVFEAEPGLSYERLLDALAQCLRVCKFFPRIPEVLELAGCGPAAIESQLDAEAEAAWIQVERFVSRHYHPDLGIHGIHSGGKYQAPPPLDRRTETAMRAVGGAGRVWCAITEEVDQSDYGWIKIEFVAAWKRAPAVEQHLLADGDLLKKLSEGLKPESDD
jgi:hypothetical protein